MMARNLCCVRSEQEALITNKKKKLCRVAQGFNTNTGNCCIFTGPMAPQWLPPDHDTLTPSARPVRAAGRVLGGEDVIRIYAASSSLEDESSDTISFDDEDDVVEKLEPPTQSSGVKNKRVLFSEEVTVHVLSDDEDDTLSEWEISDLVKRASRKSSELARHNRRRHHNVPRRHSVENSTILCNESSSQSSMDAKQPVSMDYPTVSSSNSSNYQNDQPMYYNKVIVELPPNKNCTDTCHDINQSPYITDSFQTPHSVQLFV